MTTRLLRPFRVLLLMFAALRWKQSLVWYMPDEKGHHLFSVVTLALMPSIFYGAFPHQADGFPLLRTVVLGLLIGLSTQIVVFASTVAVYQLNLESYSNHPRALNVESAIPIADALGRRDRAPRRPGVERHRCGDRLAARRPVARAPVMREVDAAGDLRESQCAGRLADVLP